MFSDDIEKIRILIDDGSLLTSIEAKVQSLLV